MPPSGASLTQLRRHPIAAGIARAWRELTRAPSRPSASPRTMLACSGGADSSALVLALAAAVPRAADLFVIAHIVHDLRPADQATADRDAVAKLADRMGLASVDAPIHVRREGGNLEGAARRLRYAELSRLAAESACPFIATAHHADDQLESVLMGLIRGAGPVGLAGVAPTRPLGRAILIRPLLGVSAADCRALCDAAAWAWREDPTNVDPTRLRAALRRLVTPELERLRPGAARRAAVSAALLRDAAGLIDDRVDLLMAQADGGAGRLAWPTATLRRERPVVLGALLRRAARELAAGAGMDRLSWRVVAAPIRATLRGPRGKVFTWAHVRVSVGVRAVAVERNPRP